MHDKITLHSHIKRGCNGRDNSKYSENTLKKKNQRLRFYFLVHFRSIAPNGRKGLCVKLTWPLHSIISECRDTRGTEYVVGAAQILAFDLIITPNETDPNKS